MSTRSPRVAAFRKFLADHPRAARWSKIAVLVLLGLYALFVVAANVFLATHLIEKEINAGTKDIEMHWGRSWTIWPGRVHVNDFSLRVNDGNVQALLTIDHATTGIDLLPLIRKKVQLRGPVAEGARFWMRHRVTAITDENRAQVAAYPPIPGAEPPLFDPEQLAKPPPPPEELWQVRLEDGEAFGDEIWVQEFRYRGAFHGTGGFYLWPLVEFTLFPTQGSLLPGLFEIGEHQVSKDLSVDLQASLARFEVPKVLGLDPLRGLDAHLVIAASMENGKFTELYRPLGVPAIAFTGGKLRAEADFRDKRFTERTDVTLTLQNAKLREKAVVVEGPLQATVKGRPAGHLELGADTSALTVQFPSLSATAKTPWRIERTSVRADLFAEIDKPVNLSLGGIRGSVIVPSLDWVAQLSAGKLHASGKVQSQVNATRDPKGNLSGSIDTTIDETQITGQDLAMAFAGTLKTSFSSTPQAQTTTFSNLALDLPIFTLRGSRSSKTTWVKSKLKTATLATEPAFTLRGEGDLEAGDSSLFAVPVENEGGVAAFAAKWLKGGQANLRGNFLVGAGSYHANLERGRVGQIEVTGFLKKVGSGPFGAFAVSTSGLSAGIRIDAGGVSVSPLAGEAWVQEQRAKAK